MNIYVGNLPFSASEDALRALFAAHGDVASVKIMTDKVTGEARGFGFVTMPNDAEAQAAMSALNGKDFEGRKLTVNEARQLPPREGGSSRGGGNGGYRGGNNRY